MIKWCMQVVSVTNTKPCYNGMNFNEESWLKTIKMKIKIWEWVKEDAEEINKRKNWWYFSVEIVFK